MRYLIFSKEQLSKYPICFLVPAIQQDNIKKEYLDPFKLDSEELLFLDLHYDPDRKKTPVSQIKTYLEEQIKPILEDMSVEYLLVSDSEYFKTLTGSTKVEANLGIILPCKMMPNIKVLYIPNYRSVFFDPEKIREKIARSINALIQDRKGSYQVLGTNIIQEAHYLTEPKQIKKWLDKLVENGDELTCDIEAFSLKHPTSGIGTITLCWSEHAGIAFPVDYEPIPNAIQAPFGIQKENIVVRHHLKTFFEQCAEKNIKLTYHSISYDVYILIYQLFMNDLLDTKGLLYGLEIMLKNWDCTKLITYLATNSCAGNKLSLKEQAQEFAGNYAIGEDIKDITNIPLQQLLEYNLIDGLSTWFVKKKHWNQLVQDEQLEIYETIFKPAIVDIIQMQLTGMPVDMEKAIEVNKELNQNLDKALNEILSSPIIQQFSYQLEEEHIRKRNLKLKSKQIKIGDEPQTFNPNSDLQLRSLLFDYLNLPIINYTKNKLPSTDGETIESLFNRTEEGPLKDLLESLQMYAIIVTLTTNFMPAILGAFKASDGWHYLFGNFNLGGTLSGRLSSSGPNLQNLPSTGKGHKIKLKFAKMIKMCFKAAPGWLLLGIDFSSLEDRISALTTKDPNKLKVYTDGYDGHSMRAVAYFGDQMPLIRLSNGKRTFKVTQNGETHYLLEGDEIALPNGKVCKIDDTLSI